MKTNSNSFHLRISALGTIACSLLLYAADSSAQSSQGPKNGNTFATAPIAGSSSSWNNPLNAKVADAVFSVNSADLPLVGNYTGYLTATNFGFTVPAGNNIDGIKVSVIRKEDNSEVKDFRIRLIKNNVIGTTDRLSGINWPAVNTARAYGSATDLWGDTWTVSDINASGFGFAIAAQRSVSTAIPVAARVDNIRITVYYSPPPGPLPVELTAFNSSLSGNSVILNWATATETNNNFFTIERSRDGNLYTRLATVAGAGNSVTVQNYSYEDDLGSLSAAVPVYYYRLSQTDFDGTEKIIALQAVKTEKQPDAFSIYPNPFKNTINVCLDKNPAEALITLTDAYGKIIYSGTKPAGSDNEFAINIPEKTHSRIYFLAVDNGHEKVVKRIMRGAE